MSSYHLDHLQYLETEAIHVMREVAAEFERPALLFSGGKDSICLLRLAEKAFRPSDIPMPFLNVETGHEFPELIEFRDRRAKELGAKLIVRTVEEAIAKGIAQPTPGEVSRNKLQIPVLLARHRGISIRLRHRRRAARRGKGPRQGTLFQLPRFASASGIRKTSARKSGTFTTPA